MSVIDNEWQMFLNAQQSNECSVSAAGMDLWKMSKDSSVCSSNEDDNDSLSEDDDDQSTSSSCTEKIHKNQKYAKKVKKTDITKVEKNIETTMLSESTNNNDPIQAPLSAPVPIAAGPGLCEDLYISTQTKIFFLNQSNLDVQKIFWNTKVIPYSCAKNGVIKKQIRFISKTKEEFQDYEKKRDLETYFTEKIMKQIDNSNARKIKFKDVRKLTVGVSKKDIMN